MLGALYDALRSANVPDELARHAAEEAAHQESRLNSLAADVRLLTWMVGTNIALTAAILVRVLFPF